MGILVNDSSRESIKQLHQTLHVIAVITAVIGVTTWFSTPFFTRDVRFNRWHQFFRWSSVIVGLSCGGGCLGAAIGLAKLDPRMKAIEKFDLAQFKNAVASELHLTMQTNSAIAQAITRERRDELGLLPIPDPESYEGYERYNDVSSNETNDPNGVTKGDNALTDQEREQIAIALADGVPDSEIVKSVLRCGGAKYQEGKRKVEAVKSDLEKEEE